MSFGADSQFSKTEQTGGCNLSRWRWCAYVAVSLVSVGISVAVMSIRGCKVSRDYVFTMTDVVGAPCGGEVECHGSTVDARCVCSDGITFFYLEPEEGFLGSRRHLTVDLSTTPASERGLKGGGSSSDVFTPISLTAVERDYADGVPFGKFSAVDEILPDEFAGKNPDCYNTGSHVRCVLGDVAYSSTDEGWARVDLSSLTSVVSEKDNGDRRLSSGACQLNYVVHSVTNSNTEWEIAWDWVGSGAYQYEPDYYYSSGGTWTQTPNFSCSDGSSYDPWDAGIRFGTGAYSPSNGLRTEWSCDEPAAGSVANLVFKVRNFSWGGQKQLDVYFWKGYHMEVLQTTAISSSTISVSIDAALGGATPSVGATGAYATWSTFCVIQGFFLVCEFEDNLWSGNPKVLMGLSDTISTGGTGHLPIQC